MSKIVIQCNTFLKNEDFVKLSNSLVKQMEEHEMVVLPVYCELRAVVDAEDLELRGAENEN